MRWSGCGPGMRRRGRPCSSSCWRAWAAQAHREAGLHIARGGPASRKPAGGYPAALTLPEMILATILPARFRMPRRVAAELFGVVNSTIAKAELQIRPLLDQRRHVIQPAGMQVKTLAELTAFAAAHGVTLIPGTKSAR